MEKKKEFKIKRITLIFIILVVIFLAGNVFAVFTGNNNIFFAIKNLISQPEIEGKENLLTDRENEEEKEEENLTNSSNKEVNDELSEKEQKEMFSKITSDKVLLQEMVSNKDFKVSEFKDKEILKLLPILDDETFTIDNGMDGSVAVANKNDVQSLAEKYFGKKIDLSEYIENDNVRIPLESGYGIVEYELVSIVKNDDKYDIEFKYIAEETNIYVLTVKYENDEMIFVSLVSDDENVIEEKIDAEKAKIIIDNYLDLQGCMEGDREVFLNVLKLVDVVEMNSEDKITVDGIQLWKTNIKYSDFKNKILTYVSENFFENRFEGFEERDGYLYVMPGGATGYSFDIAEISLKEQNDNKYVYIVDAVTEDYDQEQHYDIEAIIIQENGRFVLDSYKYISANNVKISEDEMKIIIQKYLDLVGVLEGSPAGLLGKIGFKDLEKYDDRTADNYRKTDIKYSEYKNKMLEYMTEEWFENRFTNSFKEIDGYLYYFDGGATGMTFEVESVELKGDYSDNSYIAKVYDINLDDSKQLLNLEFHVENNDGNWVISYCD